MNVKEATLRGTGNGSPPLRYAPYGRLETADGCKYLFCRSYLPFLMKRPGCEPEPCSDERPKNVVDEIIFGCEEERTGRVPADVWNWTPPRRRGR